MASDEDVNAFPEQRENQDFQGISRKLRLNMGQFLAVRTEQP